MGGSDRREPGGMSPRAPLAPVRDGARKGAATRAPVLVVALATPGHAYKLRAKSSAASSPRTVRPPEAVAAVDLARRAARRPGVREVARTTPAGVDLGETGRPNSRGAAVDHGAVLVRERERAAERFDEALSDVASFFAIPAGAAGDSQSRTRPLPRVQRHAQRAATSASSSTWAEPPRSTSPSPTGVLQGPNGLAADPSWRDRRVGLDADDRAGRPAGSGRDRSGALAAERRLDRRASVPGDEVHRVPPATGRAEARPGVGAHLDFSLVTSTLQDEVGGLQVARPDGEWIDVPHVPGTLARTHRRAAAVRRRQPADRHAAPCGQSFDAANPLLDSPVRLPGPGRDDPPVTHGRPGRTGARLPRARRARPTDRGRRLAFGPAEWHRKGENVWCAECCG